MNEQKEWLVGQRVTAELPNFFRDARKHRVQGVIQSVREELGMTWLIVQSDDGERYDVRSDEVVSI